MNRATSNTTMKYILLFLLSFPVYAGTLSGTVSGLGAGKSVVLKSGKFSKVVSANGPYTITDGGPVTVGIQPSGQLCTVAVTNVTCANVYNVGGSITGLTASGLILRLNNSTSLTVGSGATSYKFATGLLLNSAYNVSVGIQPGGLTCSIANASGIIQGVVLNANVTCVAYRSTTVSWTLPTQNTDGTPLTDLTGYILQYGTDPLLQTGYASRFIAVPNLSSTINTLVAGKTYYFSIASVSASGGTGPRSNFASMVVQ